MFVWWIVWFSKCWCWVVPCIALRIINKWNVPKSAFSSQSFKVMQFNRPYNPVRWIEDQCSFPLFLDSIGNCITIYFVGAVNDISSERSVGAIELYGWCWKLSWHTTVHDLSASLSSSWVNRCVHCEYSNSWVGLPYSNSGYINGYNFCLNFKSTMFMYF